MVGDDDGHAIQTTGLIEGMVDDDIIDHTTAHVRDVWVGWKVPTIQKRVRQGPRRGTCSSDHPDFRIVIDHAFNQPRRLGWLKA